jgi:hypothetical protein
MNALLDIMIKENKLNRPLACYCRQAREHRERGGREEYFGCGLLQLFIASLSSGIICKKNISD